MKKLIGIFALCVSVFAHGHFSQSYKHSVTTNQPSNEFYFWKKTQILPFNELIFSWNGKRPAKGSYIFYISVKSGKWSNWMKYAEWSAKDQKTFKAEPDSSFARNNCDVISIRENQLADGFQIKIVATEGASCKDLDRLFVCSSNLEKFEASSLPENCKRAEITQIYPRSQMVLAHKRYRDLCSPTSTTAAINILLKNDSVEPALFADSTWDSQFNIYGNWILNTAEAYSFLSDQYYVYPKRLNTFDELVCQLEKNIPVVVSVKGKISDAPLIYKNGHLMTVIGWDPQEKQVICIDSAFDTDEKTLTKYPFDEFNKAWAARKNLCYFFEKVSPL